MNIKKLKLGSPDYPEVLANTHTPPQPLYHLGAPLNELLKLPAVAIVGTRRVSPYGEQVTRDFAGQLAEQGVVIISGLAYGVDYMAHEAALAAEGLCIGVLPSPLDNILPVRSRRLAQRILDNGGALVSEYKSGMPPQKQNFIARNRIMAWLADAVLITEAPEKSGALYTARDGESENRTVLAIPGNIIASGFVGSNNLIKNSKAGLVTSVKDVLNALGLASHKTPAKKVVGRNHNEQVILDLLLRGINDGDQLLEHSGLGVSEFNQVLTMLEIGSKIRPLGMNHWAIY